LESVHENDEKFWQLHELNYLTNEKDTFWHAPAQGYIRLADYSRNTKWLRFEAEIDTMPKDLFVNTITKEIIERDSYGASFSWSSQNDDVFAYYTGDSIIATNLVTNEYIAVYELPEDNWGSAPKLFWRQNNDSLFVYAVGKLWSLDLNSKNWETVAEAIEIDLYGTNVSLSRSECWVTSSSGTSVELASVTDLENRPYKFFRDVDEPHIFLGWIKQSDNPVILTESGMVLVYSLHATEVIREQAFSIDGWDENMGELIFYGALIKTDSD